HDKLLPPMDGTLHLLTSGGQNATNFDVAVTAGEWSRSFESRASVTDVTVGTLTMGDVRLALDAPIGKIPVPRDGGIDIRARRPDASVLRVIDASTSFDLDGVSVVRDDDYPRTNAQHPGIAFTERIVVSDAHSPIALTDPLGADFPPGVRQLLVGAEGYAWESVTVDFGRGGAQLVALQRGGNLEVRVSGVDPSRPSELRLRESAQALPHAYVPLTSDGTVVLRGLPARPFQLRAEVGNLFLGPVVLAEASAEIVAGETARVSLELDHAPKLDLASVSGRLLVPKAWTAEWPMITLTLLDTHLGTAEAYQMTVATPSTTTAEGFDVFDWNFASVQPGRHELAFYTSQVSIVIEAVPGANEGIELRVPPPTEVVVRVVDALSGEEALGVKVIWSPERPEGDHGGGAQDATYDAESHAYEIRAPGGPIVVRVLDWSYLPVVERIDASKDREVTLRLQPACGIRLSLRDGDTQVTLPDSWWEHPEPESGTIGKGSMMMRDRGGLRAMVTAPGTYTIQPPKLDGYVQPPLQRIEVRAGEFTEHVVQLERKKL
ncbi:MAG: hypothetical protein K8S98_14055, partial [Planctomycetes bacterium]|nr:hypothetical protein [Planctomycetota bacterium]